MQIHRRTYPSRAHSTGWYWLCRDCSVDLCGAREREVCTIDYENVAACDWCGEAFEDPFDWREAVLTHRRQFSVMLKEEGR